MGAEQARARSGWLVGLIALAGGLAAPMSMPVAGPLAMAYGPAAAPTYRGPAAGALRDALAGAHPDLAAFYAARGGRPLWIEGRRLRPQARTLVARLREAEADNLRPADYAADVVAAQVASAESGRPGDLARAELALSAAFAGYVSDLHRPLPGAEMLYSDPALPAPTLTPRGALEILGGAASLDSGLAAATRMNPLYTRLRAELAAERARGGPRIALLRANLERARALPAELGRRYILVDITAQQLWIYEDGVPRDSMRVVVGKPDEPTPAMAALVRYAVFRPYWNVPPDLVRDSTAPKVLRQGLDYFRNMRLEVLSDWSERPSRLQPERIDWRAVAQGRAELRVRQLPGPDNMMGRVKFIFPNELGVYLHDSPLRSLFSGEERLASAGCVRLEDATRLARWLLGPQAVAAGEAPGPPETRADLREPVPVYLLYLTATPTGAGLSVRKDIYGRDAPLIAKLDAGAAPPAAGGPLATAVAR